MRRSMTKSPLLVYSDEVKFWSDVPVGSRCILRCDVFNVPGYPPIKEVHVTEKLEKTDVYNAKTKDDYGNTIYLMIDDDEFVAHILPIVTDNDFIKCRYGTDLLLIEDKPVEDKHES